MIGKVAKIVYELPDGYRFKTLLKEDTLCIILAEVSEKNCLVYFLHTEPIMLGVELVYTGYVPKDCMEVIGSLEDNIPSLEGLEFEGFTFKDRDGAKV